MNSSRSKLPSVVAAVTLTALLYAFGFALDPVPWLLWLAPLPILLLAPRAGTWTTVAAAGAGWLLGGLRFDWYWYDSIEMPVGLLIMVKLVTTTGFLACVLLFRGLVLRKLFLPAALGFASAWVVFEYVLSLLFHFAAGNWYSIAYTQADVLPVLQTASVAGTAGIAFLLTIVPAAIAAMLAPGAMFRARSWTGGVAAVLLVAALGYGVARPQPSTEPVRVAALAYERTGGSVEMGTPEGDALVERYRDGIAELAADGVSTVVLPETLVAIDENRLRHYEWWVEVAESANVTIVVGVRLEVGSKVRNTALVALPDGKGPWVYTKHHLIPGLEDAFTAPAETDLMENRHWGVVICKDLDYASFIAEFNDDPDWYGSQVSLLFVPALDFEVDGWWHSRIGVTRGVEQGMSVARTGQQGLVTVSDQYGRVLDQDEVVAVATVGTNGASTMYARFGDWLVWVCAALVLVALEISRRRPIVT